MQGLGAKKILLGISGGIAAYKSADLTRKLIETGADVRVVMTAGAQAFISPLTFQALSGRPVHTDLLDTAAEAAMGHIELARWADMIVIAPASANTIARLANGFASDLLSTLCLATDAPVILAPAMNRLMWSHPATTANVDQLAQRGVTLLGPGTGDQACGETGAGRMLEPLEIRDALISFTSNINSQTPGHSATASAGAGNHTDNNSLNGARIMITAGPTREPIDPVRYLSNRSSGKMGFAVAQAAHEYGAHITLVAGPVNLPTPAGVSRVDVVSANDMHDAVLNSIAEHDIFISVAAVADYRVAEVASQKIKKNNSGMTLQLERNPDILADVAGSANAPFCVGFAAETEHVEKHARDKLARKKLNLIAANQVAQENNAVFNTDTNALEVFWPDGGHTSIASASKKSVADQLIAIIAVQYAACKT